MELNVDVPTFLEFFSHRIIEIAVPVILTLLFDSVLARFIEQKHGSANLNRSFSQTMNPTQDGVSVAWSIYLTLILVAMIIIVTAIILVCYYYGCLKAIVVWMVIAVSLLLSFYIYQGFKDAPKLLNIAADYITIVLFMLNMVVVGNMSIFWRAPPTFTHAILIIISVLIAIVFMSLPDWTVWILLVILVIYDCCVVLCPHGLLNVIIKKSEERGDAIPALVYSSAVWMSKIYHPSNEYENGDAAEDVDDVENFDQTDENNNNDNNDDDNDDDDDDDDDDAAEAQDDDDNDDNDDESGSGSGSGSEDNNNNSIKNNDDDNEKKDDNKDNDKKDDKNDDTNDYKDENEKNKKEDNKKDDSDVDDIPLDDSDDNKSARSKDGKGSAREKSKKNKKKKSKKKKVGNKNDEVNQPLLAEGENGSEESVVKTVKTAVLLDDGKSEEEETSEQKRKKKKQKKFESDDEEGIKLGLGDFVFYGILVTRAARIGWDITILCVFAVILGLSITLIFLAWLQRALPALPFSLVLGILFYIIGVYTFRPFYENISAMKLAF